MENSSRKDAAKSTSPEEEERLELGTSAVYAKGKEQLEHGEHVRDNLHLLKSHWCVHVRNDFAIYIVLHYSINTYTGGECALIGHRRSDTFSLSPCSKPTVYVFM
jgi:hypothetical protein